MKHRAYNILLLYFILTTNLIIAQNNNKQDSGSFVYIDKVLSYDELINKFKGRIVYIDFWATWCGPCIEGFKSEPKLDDFIISNNIIRLYIALERQEKEPEMQLKSIEKWENATKKYNLIGTHYYAQYKSEFMREITEKIMKGNFAIPHFAIIDKNGIIVERNAKNPSNVNGLIKELSKYLNQH